MSDAGFCEGESLAWVKCMPNDCTAAYTTAQNITSKRDLLQVLLSLFTPPHSEAQIL